jgi:hypothetical protein
MGLCDATKLGPQVGGAILQAGEPVHIAFPPSAHRSKPTQQPGVAQSHTALWSTNTEWQSARASHESWSVTLAHGIGVGQATAGQANPVPG